MLIVAAPLIAPAQNIDEVAIKQVLARQTEEWDKGIFLQVKEIIHFLKLIHTALDWIFVVPKLMR